MGQYFKPMTVRKVGVNRADNTVIARPLKWMYSHDYDNGLKLMEHSWLLNPFVNTFAKTLLTDKPKRVVWGGDYADGEPNTNYKEIDSRGEERTYDKNLYTFCDDDIKIKPDEITVEEQDEFLNKRPYLCNYTKKEYVDLRKLPKDNDGWRVHPLPLLTSDGNGRGGGDYHNDNVTFVGVWTRNYIAFRTRIPKEFKEIKPNFIDRM
jgi:hypothetical protein